MKHLRSIGLTLAISASISMSAFGSDIPWTWDDFDNNCNVVDGAKEPAVSAQTAVSQDAGGVQPAREIPWTWDDFDSECNVVHGSKARPGESFGNAG